jgi:hypothetical protein
MLKRSIVLVAVALAAAPGAEESSSLRIDASSGRAFERSLVAFRDELSPEHRQALGNALVDIWIAGTQAADAERGKYRKRDYYRQIDGLSYEEAVAFTTGESAKLRDRQQSEVATELSAPRRSAPRVARPWPEYERPSPWAGVPPAPASWEPRSRTPLFGPGPPPR